MVDLAQLVNDLQAEISELKSERASLMRELKYARDANHLFHDYEEHRAYLVGKIARQRAAIRAIQRVGWQPGLIIRELPSFESGVDEMVMPL